MGQGPTIQELAERDQEFRTYLTEIRAEVEGDLKKDTDALKGRITDYYEQGGWSYQPLMETDKVDVQQVSAWSLSNVTKIVSEVRDAIFGDASPPDGVEIEKPESFNLAAAQIQDLRLLALNRAFGAVQGILETFATETSYRGQAITKVELVAPGMTLFISIRSDTYKRQGFFNNEAIAQYLFVLRVFFSSEQAGDISEFNDILAYEELKAAWRVRIGALAKKIASPETPFSALQELDEELGYYAGQLSSLQAKIDELTAKETMALLEGVRAIRVSRSAARVRGIEDEMARLNHRLAQAGEAVESLEHQH